MSFRKKKRKKKPLILFLYTELLSSLQDTAISLSLPIEHNSFLQAGARQGKIQPQTNFGAQQ